MQYNFNLRTLFWVVALCCIGAASIGYVMRWLSAGTRAGREKHFRALMAHDPRIEDVSIGGYEEELGQFDVTSVSLAIRGKPNRSIVLFVPNGETDLKSLSINQIGNLSPVILEWDAEAQAWTPRCPSLGDESDYRPPLPWTNLAISDLVSRYDELVRYFSDWPTYPNYREMTSNSGALLRYYIEPPNVNTKDTFIPSD